MLVNTLHFEVHLLFSELFVTIFDKGISCRMQPEISSKLGRPVTKCVKLYDMTGLKFSQLAKMKVRRGVERGLGMHKFVVCAMGPLCPSTAFGVIQCGEGTSHHGFKHFVFGFSADAKSGGWSGRLELSGEGGRVLHRECTVCIQQCVEGTPRLNSPQR